MATYVVLARFTDQGVKNAKGQRPSGKWRRRSE